MAENGIAQLRFLGTGAAGGIPGQGRSRRRESSALLDADKTVLVDVTRDFNEQAADLVRIDAVLLTHAHADAAGGFSQLVDWCLQHHAAGLPVYAHPEALARVERDHPTAAGVDLRPVQPGRRVRVGRWSLTGLEVPHAKKGFPTFAWRLSGHGRRLVYASDVARPTAELEGFCRGVDHLVLDGATWRRRIFSHLRIDEDLPTVCAWKVGRIWLTQIGKSAPPHEELETAVAELCPRATPAHDGLAVAL